MQRRAFLAAGGTALFAGCISGGRAPSDDAGHVFDVDSIAEKFVDDGIAVRFGRWETMGGSPTVFRVAATLENTADVEYGRVQFTATFYDGNDRIDQRRRTIPFFGPGERYRLFMTGPGGEQGRRVSHIALAVDGFDDPMRPLNDGHLAVHSETVSEGMFERLSVSGELENLLDRTILRVYVHYNFYSDDLLVDTSTDKLNALFPGERRSWTVEARPGTDEITDHKRRITLRLPSE